MASSEILQYCTRCATALPLTSFPWKKNGTGRLKSCLKCTLAKDKYNQSASEKRKTEKENITPAPPTIDTDSDSKVADAPVSHQAEIKNTKSTARLEELPLEDVVRMMEEYQNAAFDLDCEVIIGDEDFSEDFDGDSDIPLLSRAHAVARLVRKATGWRFNMKEQRRSQSSPQNAVVVEYYCAQSVVATESRPFREHPIQRKRAYMDRFSCNGILQVTISNIVKNRIRIRLQHHLSHIKYCDISTGEDVKKLVHEMKHCNASTIWQRYVRENPETELTSQQIYHVWVQESETAWKLDNNPIISARKLLERHQDLKTELIPLRDEAGISSIAFAFKEIVQAWGKHTEELAIDSTWNTARNHYELFAIVAEANGQAMPLAFVFTASTDGTAESGAKERLLEDIFEWLILKGVNNVKFTLADKDQSEINALTRCFKSKHNSCYWHAIKYVEERLAENKAPADYNAKIAHQVFDFIDPTWVPGVTRTVDDDMPDQTNLQNEEVEVLASAKTCRPALFVLKLGEERIPIWPSKPKILKASLPQFCPQEYRTSIVEKFRRHACLHPEIPFDDEHGTHVSAEAIHKGAVKDMYDYCFANDLSQVWAYLWNRWYSPDKWKLWARASCPLISRLRTTMIVESLWRHIKHGLLNGFNRPRLDLVTHLVLENLLPVLKNKLDRILARRRVGRPQSLAPWQKDLKRDWEDMSKPDEYRNIKKELKILRMKETSHNKKKRAEQLEYIRQEGEREAGTYHTDIKRWTCSCPSFLLSRFMICKHLIRNTNKHFGGREPEFNFFLNLRRRHSPPFYYVEGLHDIEFAPKNFDYEPEILTTIAEDPGVTGNTCRERVELENGSEYPYDDVTEARINIHKTASARQDFESPGSIELESTGTTASLNCSKSILCVDNNGTTKNIQLDQQEMNKTNIEDLQVSTSAKERKANDGDGDGKSGNAELRGNMRVDGVGRARPTEAYLTHMKRTFDEAFNILQDMSGHNPIFLERFMLAARPLENITAELRDHKNGRTRRRTWKDSNSHTIYLDI